MKCHSEGFVREGCKHAALAHPVAANSLSKVSARGVLRTAAEVDDDSLANETRRVTLALQKCRLMYF